MALSGKRWAGLRERGHRGELHAVIMACDQWPWDKFSYVWNDDPLAQPVPKCHPSESQLVVLRGHSATATDFLGFRQPCSFTSLWDHPHGGLGYA